MLLFLAALSMYLVSLASMVLPVLVGRVFFQLISFAKQDGLSFALQLSFYYAPILVVLCLISNMPL